MCCVLDDKEKKKERLVSCNVTRLGWGVKEVGIYNTGPEGAWSLDFLFLIFFFLLILKNIIKLIKEA